MNALRKGVSKIILPGEASLNDHYFFRDLFIPYPSAMKE